MAKLSVVISAYNEETNIANCLKSVANLADESIVVDNQSTDRTAKIAADLSAQVFSRPNNLMFNVNKNFGFTKATGDWLLNLDADEEVTPELKDEIITLLSEPRPEINGYWIPRKNIIFGKWIKHAFWWPDEQLRLFRRGKGKFPEKHIHEYLSIDGPTGHLTSALSHLSYTGISHFVDKLDKAKTESEAETLYRNGQKTKWQDFLNQPIDDFLKIYFLQSGNKDNLHGLVLAYLQSFYSILTLSKVWEKEGFPDINVNQDEFTKLLKQKIKEINYWLISREIENTNNQLQKTILKLKRKLFLSQ